jgi:hypothetical protein
MATKKAARRKKPAPDKIRSFSVRLKDSVLKRLYDRAEREGMKLQGAMEQAVGVWLAPNTQAALEELTPFPDLTAEETRVLSGCLHILRSGQEDLQIILRALARRQARESRASGGGA